MPLQLSGPSINITAGGPNSGLLFIEALRSEGVAPFGIIFRAYWAGEDDGHGTADFVWGFADEGATFDNYDADNCPLPNNRNVAYGPVVSHTFRSPGSFTVTCTSRKEDGTTASTSRLINALDPDEVTWTKDIYVSYANDFTGVPSAGSVVKHVTTRSGLSSELGDIVGASIRVRFRRGETYDIGASPRNYALLWAGAFGEGADPVLTQLRTGSESGTLWSLRDFGDCCISEVAFSSGYDPVAGAFDTDFTRTVGVKALDEGIYLTVDRVTAAGMTIAFYVGGSGHNSSVIYNDCNVSNWHDYGSFGFPQNFGVCGGFWRQHPDVKSYDGKASGGHKGALEDPPTRDLDDPDHGPIRLNLGPLGRISVQSVSLRALGGWTIPGGAEDGERVAQPCLRLIPKDFDNTAMRIAVMHSTFMGGGTVSTYGMQRDTDPWPSTGKLLIDGNRLNPDRWSSDAFSTRGGNVVYQNNIMIMPDVLHASATDSGSFRSFLGVRARGVAVAESVYSAPILFRNNTMIDLRSQANAPLDIEFVRNSDTENLTNVTVRDNLVSAPNVPNASDFPDWSPLTAGYAPDTGSAAIGEAVGPAPYRDMLANIRPASASVGALEPAE